MVKKALLDHISLPSDLRQLDPDQLPQVAQELRDFIINIVATKEGHLGASLGVIELTIALHYVFDTPNDLLVWDVGHQAYGHKILTGRKTIFHTKDFKSVVLVLTHNVLIFFAMLKGQFQSQWSLSQ